MTCLTESLTSIGQTAEPAHCYVKVLDVYREGRGRISLLKREYGVESKWVEMDVIQGQEIKWHRTADSTATLKISKIYIDSGRGGVMQFTVCWGPRERLSYIGNITYEIDKSIGMDEIDFDIPIKNTDVKSRWFYVELYNEAGDLIDKEPDFIKPIVGAGEVYTLKMSSKLKMWHIGSVEGQTVKFILKSKDGLLDKYEAVESKAVNVEKYADETGAIEEPKKDKVEIVNMFYPEKVEAQESYEMKFTVGLILDPAITSGNTIVQLFNTGTDVLVGEERFRLNSLLNKEQEVIFKSLMIESDQHYRVVVIDDNIWPFADTIQDSREFTVKFKAAPEVEDEEDEEKVKINMLLYLIVFILVFGVLIKKRS